MPAPDVDARRVAWVGAAIAATVVVVVGAVLLLLRAWHVAPGADRARLPYDLVVEGPALQSAPQPELAAERAGKARILATSGWVDGPNGIVRIPIETAMRILAERSAGPASAALASAASAAAAPASAAEGAR